MIGKFQLSMIFLISASLMLALAGCSDSDSSILSYDVKSCVKKIDSSATMGSDGENIDVKKDGTRYNIHQTVTHQCGQNIGIEKRVVGRNLVLFETILGMGAKCVCNSEIDAVIGPLDGNFDSVQIMKKDGTETYLVYEIRVKAQNENPENECFADSDCAKAGCSGQLCMAKAGAAETTTTCEFKEEYNCYQMSGCGCVDGKCMWKENSDFLTCLKKYI